MNATTTTGWLQTLQPEERERVYAAMRTVRQKSDRLLTEHRMLSPPQGSIPVGGAHMDSFFVGNALAELLSGLNKGMTPDDAAHLAEDAGRESVEAWNRRRGKDYQTHRWVHCADADVWDTVRQIQGAVR